MKNKKAVYGILVEHIEADKGFKEFCFGQWEDEATVSGVKDGIGFGYNDMFIINPFVSENGMESLESPFDYYDEKKIIKMYIEYKNRNKK